MSTVTPVGELETEILLINWNSGLKIRIELEPASEMRILSE